MKRNTLQKTEINQWNFCISVKWNSEYFHTQVSAGMHRMYALKYSCI